MRDVRADVSSSLETTRKGWARIFLLQPGEIHRIYHPSTLQHPDQDHTLERLYVRWDGVGARVVHVIPENMLVDPEDSPIICYCDSERQQFQRVDVKSGTVSNKPKGISVWSARFSAGTSGLIEVHDSRVVDIEVFEFRLRDPQTLPRKVKVASEKGETFTLRGSSFESAASDECCKIAFGDGYLRLKHQVLLRSNLEFSPGQRYQVLLDGEELMLGKQRQEVSVRDRDRLSSVAAIQWCLGHQIEAGQVLEIIDRVSNFSEVVHLV